MNILFVGMNVPDAIEYQVQNISAAGNRFQNNIVGAFREVGHHVSVLSFLAVPFSDKFDLELNRELDYKYIKRKRGIVGLLGSIFLFQKRIKEEISRCDFVICYNCIYAWLCLPVLARKMKKKSVMILADYSDTCSYTSIAKKIYARMQKKSIRKYDLVVGLSEASKRLLRVNQKFLLMEGGITQNVFEELQHPLRERRDGVVLAYSGLLNQVTGVDLFLEAMRKIVDDSSTPIKVLVSGKGEYEGRIGNMADKYDWLEFKGHMPYSAYIEMIRDADILVNPRDMRLQENANNFPSKILDYLATGNEIVSTKFPGYVRFMDCIHFTEVEELENTLKETIVFLRNQTMQDWENRYETNRHKAEQYLWDRQIKRILTNI